jgi:hypothetical protein
LDIFLKKPNDKGVASEKKTMEKLADDDRGGRCWLVLQPAMRAKQRPW